MKCTKCSAEIKDKATKTGLARLPRGWKRLETKDASVVFCPACWKSMYHLRAITFPLAGPAGPFDTPAKKKEAWDKLRQSLTAAWASTTMLANWLVTELVKADKVRTPDMEKLPGFKVPYLYPQARIVCPAIDPQSVVAILNTVQANYMRRRLDTIWRGSASLQTYRFPMPYPVPAQGWSARWLSEDQKVPIVRVRICGQPYDLRLRGGPGFYRQLRDFALIVSGDAQPCEMAIYRVRGNASDNRPGMTGHEDGGQSVQWTIMIKLVAWIPKQENVTRKDKAVLVRTEKERFLVADPEGARPWIINAEHVFRWQAEHARRRQHMSEDRKYGKRWPKEAGQQMQDRLTNWVDKHKRRMDTWCHQCAASIVGWLVRQKVARVEYNDSVTMTPEFPWFKLRELIAQKCNVHHIAFEHASAKVKEKTEDPLADAQ